MIAAVLAAALMAAAPAAAPAAATGTEAPTKAAKPAADEMVCKKEAVVGSRLKSKVCMTQADWDRRKQDSKDELDAAQRNQPMRTGQ